MTNELVINARPHETRVALVENGTVVELHVKRGPEQELVGNIYLGGCYGFYRECRQPL